MGEKLSRIWAVSDGTVWAASGPALAMASSAREISRGLAGIFKGSACIQVPLVSGDFGRNDGIVRLWPHRPRIEEGHAKSDHGDEAANQHRKPWKMQPAAGADRPGEDVGEHQRADQTGQPEEDGHRALKLALLVDPDALRQKRGKAGERY